MGLQVVRQTQNAPKPVSDAMNKRLPGGRHRRSFTAQRPGTRPGPGSRNGDNTPGLQKQALNKTNTPAEWSLYRHNFCATPIRQYPNTSDFTQPKLTIGQPNNKYERQAERMEKRVMTMPASSMSSSINAPLSNETAANGTASADWTSAYGKRPNQNIEQSLHTAYSRDEEIIQAKMPGGMAAQVNPALRADLNLLQAGGHTLSSSARRFFEPRFGRDFSSVRVHSDTLAANMANSINARAFTSGHHVVFAAGEYAPDSVTGRRLLAHELTHVLQQGGPLIQRKPQDKNKTELNPESSTQEKSSDENAAKCGKTKVPLSQVPIVLPALSWIIDLLHHVPVVSPAAGFVDSVWAELVECQKLSKEETKELKLSGKEKLAISSMVWALIHAYQATKHLPEKERQDKYWQEWSKYTGELHKLTGGTNVYLDLFSLLTGTNIEGFLGSERFTSKLKEDPLGVIVLGLLVQGIYSTSLLLKAPTGELGTFQPGPTEHLGLVSGIGNLAFKNQLAPPGFFGVGPLKTSVHPAYGATPFGSGGPPSGLAFEYNQGFGPGQGGQQSKFQLSLNAAQLAALANDELSASDVADPRKYRGFQSSAWFSYDNTDPSQAMKQAGTLSSQKISAGAIVGGGGHLGLFSVGTNYRGEDALPLTSFFLHGGYGYSGATGSIINKIGFEARYMDWTEAEVLAPIIDGKPVSGFSGQVTPFANFQFGDQKHKFGVGAALSFVSGSEESLGVSMLRGDLSYTYLGNRSADQLPVFKMDLSASMHRLDWWDPNSPLMWGLGPKVWLDPVFVGAQVHTGAGEISEERAKLIDTDTVRVKVPTTLLFNTGVSF